MASITSLDKIVRNTLLQKQMSIHFYLQYLVYARDCLRELSCDVLKTLNYTLLELDEWNEACIPCGMLDAISVGFEVGQHMRPLVSDNSLNSLVNYGTNGERISFNQAAQTVSPRSNFLIGQEDLNFGWQLNWGNGWNYYSRDDYGENMGRIFGYRGIDSDTFKVIWERNKIKVNEDVSPDRKFVLTWIGDGSCSDAATMITNYAFASIDTYIKWQTKENSRAYNEGEKERAKQEFKEQRRILIGRLSDINSLDDILRSMQKGYYNGQHT